MDVFVWPSEGIRPASAKQTVILFATLRKYYRLQIQRPLDSTIWKGRARKPYVLSELWAEAADKGVNAAPFYDTNKYLHLLHANLFALRRKEKNTD